MTLAASDLHFGYRTGRTVLAGVSLSPAPGTLTAIVGPNGAGKSTLLRLLLGTLTPMRGTVTLDGQLIAALGAGGRAARLAYLGQRPELSSAMTARQAVALGRYGVGPDDAAVVDAMERTSVVTLAEEPFHTLSMGQQQRVMLARVLAQVGPNPAGKTVLADEPAAALDPLHTLQTLRSLRDLATRGAAVVVVMHDLSAARNTADMALALRVGGAGGTVAAQGAARDVITPALMREVFGVGFEEARAGSGAVALTAVK